MIKLRLAGRCAALLVLDGLGGKEASMRMDVMMERIQGLPPHSTTNLTGFNNGWSNVQIPHTQLMGNMHGHSVEDAYETLDARIEVLSRRVIDQEKSKTLESPETRESTELM
ncbi:hypothetical protein KSP39_PZI007916 [Platanthera zijinensis]|uniref:Uncharacterized protein n=1 Tax=Platanthera zijinensis TaxID=2320716 RepID=A0AAP0G8G1_9ASPA